MPSFSVSLPPLCLLICSAIVPSPFSVLSPFSSRRDTDLSLAESLAKSSTNLLNVRSIFQRALFLFIGNIITTGSTWCKQCTRTERGSSCAAASAFAVPHASKAAAMWRFWPERE
ncbi:hypothetical protein DACRYDRAFT_22150 [Dacryopinax primogenitus]|uniref:Secreted protein n=1 Tax=Dacryopinax primogenitus (strain DJM 731) TaxID=1858805 RepID=M5FZ00_DACPD|nr:uncharacterized protein DACRYDRAFT_22150 [Dacryopinax primogenitus]EJU01729.1 hypothetical protein DACRYDRAFT_22150 [Dacryopinax primogenitus]